MLPLNVQRELLEELSASRDDYMRYLARRVNHLEDRDDIIQHAYGKAVAHIDQLRDETRLRGWFQGILRRCVVDFYAASSREVSRRQQLKDEPHVWATAATSEGRAGELTGLCHCGESFLEDMSEKTVELVRRVDLGDECPSEVAPELGLTANSARVRLHRAHAKLREELRNHCAIEGESYRDFLDCECTGC